MRGVRRCLPGRCNWRGRPGDVRANQATVYFAAAAVKGASNAAVKTNDIGLPAGGLDHAVVSGDVRLMQPGRQGTGEQLMYKAADGSFLLTGTASVPPRIVDAQQGTVTGASLLVPGAGDSTIVVAGGPTVDSKPQRARIETHVRQKH